MISGTYVLTDTIDKAFNAIFTESYANTDAVVSSRSPNISFEGTEAEAPPIPADLLEQVQSVPSVESATGSIADTAQILNRQGDAVETQGAPALAFGIDPEQQRFNPLNLEDGRWPRGASEVVIDVDTAISEGYAVGDEIGIATRGPVQQFTLVGIARYGAVESLGSATFSVFDLATAQTLFDKEGQFDAISVAAKDGVTPEELVRDLGAELPAAVEVHTGVEQGQEDSEEVSEFTTFIRYFLLAFGGIALFVGAFVIFNTLSITVAQRTREFATLRTIGASRRQILGSVIVEALVIGVVASIVGLFLGFGLASGLNALFKALELDLPTTALVYATRTFVVALIVGVVITLLAGLVPAIRATRVPPIAAVREGSPMPRSRLAPFAPWIAIAATGGALALLLYALFADDLGTAPRLLSIAGGVLLMFFGVALLSSRLVRPLAALLGWPAARIGGVAGKLARGNATRNTGRTAATAAALMIGIALVTFVAVLADGMKASNREAIEDQIKADYVVTSADGYTPFTADAGAALASAGNAELSSDVRSDLAKLAGESGYLTGIDPQEITQVYRFDWDQGSDSVLAELGQDGAIVDKDFAEDKNLAIGDTFTAVTPDGERARLEVKATYQPPPFYPLLGKVSISKKTFDTLYERPRNQFTFVNVPGPPSQAALAQLEQATRSFPDTKVRDREAWVDEQDAEFNQFLLMLYILLALSVIVSLFGMVNTLVLSVFERTRELGMLRAVGMTRRQTRRMVRHESVITALIGAALGLPLGILLAFLVTKALSQFEVRFSIPIGLLVIFTIVAIFVGLFAAIMPARRAAKLNVLRALQYE